MGLQVGLPAGIREALAQGRTVITSNQRASRALERGFDRQMHASGAKHWQPAAVMTLEAWGTGLWNRLLLEGMVTRVLLNRTQEHALWRELIAADRETVGVRSADALAEMAAEAWSLLCRYNGAGRLREIAVSTDTAAFERWAMAFQRRCQRDGWLSAAELWMELDRLASRAELPVADPGLMLVGFDRVLPAVGVLFETLRKAGFAVDEHPLQELESERLLVAAADERDEMIAAARWARDRVAQGDRRVAVVVPNLEARRAELDRALREVLGDDAALVPYEFSLGTQLAETPMVAVALELIRWTRQPLSFARVSGLLLSPYFGGGGWALAEFDAFRLRKTRTLRPEISLERIRHAVATDAKADELRELIEQLHGMRRVAVEERLASDSAERTYAEWSEVFARVLSAAGWPGATLDGVRFQLQQRWQSALDELCTLDFDGSACTFANALTALERICRQTTFAPESTDAPVQVLGPLETAGQTFDAVWFLGASDAGWPSRRRTTPFLPWQMQRDLGIPGADAAADARVAAATTSRIAGTAPRVVFSYAARLEDAHHEASAMLDGLGVEVVALDDLVDLTEERDTYLLDLVDDDVKLPQLADEVHRGGAQLLEAQAACSFRAFAEHRLGSSELESIEAGLDARESGSLIHKVMERFWTEAQDQQRLKAMSTEERTGLLERSIHMVLTHAAQRHGVQDAWEQAYLGVQSARLRALLGPWIEMEMARPAFAVHAMEQRLEAVIGPLRLTVRVDRVDETADGLLILDYKTGRAAPSDWLSDRPDKPQLPLYAVAAQEAPAGVAFALLRAGAELNLSGYGAQGSVLEKPAKLPEGVASVGDQVALWREVLEGLAVRFHAGDTRVNPKVYPRTCQYCAQRLLCRVNPELLNLDEDEAEQEAELG